MDRFRIVATACVFAVFGCDPGYDPPNRDFTVKLWVQPEIDLPPDQVLAGCMTWSAFGVGCELVDSEQQGEVRVYAVDVDRCMWSTEGYVLGVATYGGDVSVSVGCLKVTGLPYDGMLREVVGHEIGHQLGIWEHVPYVCDGTEKVHPDGEHVCGLALMNAEYHLGVESVTHIDELAFDLRSQGSSVVGAAPETASGARRCVFVKRR